MLSYCTTAEMLWVKGHHVHHGTHRDLRVLPRNKATHATYMPVVQSYRQ